MTILSTPISNKMLLADGRIIIRVHYDRAIVIAITDNIFNYS